MFVGVCERCARTRNTPQHSITPPWRARNNPTGREGENGGTRSLQADEVRRRSTATPTYLQRGGVPGDTESIVEGAVHLSVHSRQVSHKGNHHCHSKGRHEQLTLLSKRMHGTRDRTRLHTKRPHPPTIIDLEVEVEVEEGG